MKVCRTLGCFLVVMLYIFTIIGFDIHNDAHDGRSYFVMLISGTSCEDIHPEDQCKCCHHHSCKCSSDCKESGDDCTDTIGRISLTGTDHSDSNDIQFVAIQTSVISSPLTRSITDVFSRSVRLRFSPPLPVQHNVLRI